MNMIVTVEETVDDKACYLDRTIDDKRYNSPKTLLIVTCFVVWFKNNLLAKLRKITTKEFDETEKHRVISEQKYLSDENFRQLKNNLDLFYDDLKILRLKRTLWKFFITWTTGSIPFCYENFHILLI